MADLQTRLDASGVWRSVLRSGAAQGFLTTIQLGPLDPLVAPDPDREEGTATLGVMENLLGAFRLNLVAPLQPRRCVLRLSGPAASRTGFRFAISLNEGPQQRVLELLDSLPGHGLRAAVRNTSADAEWLDGIPGAPPVVLAGAAVWLVLRGEPGKSVEVLISPNMDPPDDVVVLRLQPSTVLVGGTGFGLEFKDGIAFDDADDAVPPGKTVIDGVVIDTPADRAEWRGIAVRTARFYLPKGVPFLGGHAVDAHVQIGRAPTPGIDLLILAKVPPQGQRPGIEVRIECRDPTAVGLDGFVPTLVEAVMELPLAGRTEAAPGGPLTFGGGKPVKVRARFSRKPAASGTAPSTELSLAIESQGPDGLVKIDSATGGLGAKVAVTAATLASALVADGSGTAMHAMLTAAVGLSSFLEAGQLVLHRAEILTSGSAAPVGKAVQLKIDYSVAAVVTGIDVGVLAVQMNPQQPLRVRVREVVLTVDPEKSGLDMIGLDYTKSSLEVEDPGGWKVKGLDNLFDVLGTRSGRGSMWIEVDLRFKLDLGPVKVSGATLRATLDDKGKLSGSMRGLDASVALAPLITARGGVQLTEHGFRAALSGSIEPLGVTASADVETVDAMVKLALGVDLPGPIPLANTGLGIYGLGGVFVANGRPAPVPPGADAIKFQLDWDYRNAGSFVPSSDFSFGLEAVIGTAPDMGFTFSARAGIFLTTPDIVVRGSLRGVAMAPRVTIARDEPIAKLLEVKGAIVIDPKDAVTIAVDGIYEIPHIVVTHVPVAARFPTTNGANWFIHFGSDGWAPGPGVESEGREAGPISSTLFPEILGQSSDAYIMFRGNGVTDWPRGGNDSGGLKVTCGPKTFVSAFGFGFNAVWGLKPIVWAELFARADVLFSTQPTTMAAMGRVGGGLHVGFFSVGVDATVFVVLMEKQDPYLHAEVCGTIDLFFHEIHKCVAISYNGEPSATLPPPDAHPLDGPQSVVDDRYQVIVPLFGTREEASEVNAVWPDAIPLLSFITAPKLSGGYAQFPKANAYPGGNRAKPQGGDLVSYDWELTELTLVDATDAANEKVVPGTLSAAWLDGKFGDAGGQAQPAELALLTPFGDLWFDALPDAGKSLEHDPLGTRAGICQLHATARLGWAPGGSASVCGDGWALPPDPLSVDALQSQVHAQLELRWIPSSGSSGFVLDHLSIQLVPARVAYAMPRVRPLAAPADFDGRRFTALLDVGGSVLPAGTVPDLPQLFSGPTQQLRAAFAEPLRQARLWLVIDRAAWAPQRLRVVDDLGVAWPADKVETLDADRVAVRFASPGAGEAKGLAVTHPIGIRLGVLGIGGVTRSAALAADARNAATQAEADLLAKANDNGPSKGGSSSTERCVLEAGHLYRIDVTMRWSGSLFKRDDKGNKVVVAQKAAGPDTIAPTRPYWFRTAKPKPVDKLAKLATVERYAQIQRKRDFFHPAMLERYLLGYEPAQSELFRFANDPVRAYFSVGHVGALAATYDYKLGCGLRRLDAPQSVEPDQVLKATLGWATAAAFLSGPTAIRAEAYATSVCKMPPPNAMLQAPMQLSRLSWYEVYALAEATKAGVVDGRLPGVSFRTSRWTGGADMLNGLNFARVVAGKSTGRATGGAMIRSSDAVLAPMQVAGDDAALDAFLDRLGLDGWPTAAEPRISLLWRQQAGAWRCAGVFIESPEPIHRPGRFEVDALALTMGAAGHAVAFDIRLRDRSGSRLLFATTTPFTPVRVLPLRSLPLLQLQCRDLPIGGAAVALSGSLTVPLQPSFAEEAL